MSVVLYALGAGLIGWGGYMLLASDTFAAIDIAANLAGWGVFAIGLGAVTGALRRLARVVETTGQPRRPRADPRFRPPGGRSEPARSEEPAQAAPAGRVEPAVPHAAAPALAPVFEPRLDAIALRDPEPADEPQSLPAPDLWLDRRPHAPEAREPVVAEPAAPALSVPLPVAPPPPEPEPVAEEAPAAEPPPPSIEPVAAGAAEEAGEDDADAGLSKKERKQRRREARLREESETIEQPEVIAPQLGGGRRIFGGPDRDRGREAFEMPGPVAPPLARAPLPFERFRSRLPLAMEPEKAASEPAAPESGEPESVEPAPVVSPAPGSAAAEPAPELASALAPAVAKSEPAEPKVPEWLARARARRQARADELPAPEVSEPQPETEDERDPDPVPEPVTAEVETAIDETAAAPEEVAPEPEPELEPEPAPEPIVAPANEPAGPQVVREGEHRGVTYRFFDDGSVEALSAHGKRRFGSVEELRATVIAARGPSYEEAEAEAPGGHPFAEALPEPQLQNDLSPRQPAGPEPDRAPDVDPLEAALSELESGDAPPAKRA